MRLTAFASRCAKEIIRDPLSVVFGVGFPVVLLVFMSLLKKSIKDMPQEMFAVETFTPGMMVFGLSFIMLFLGMLVMNDRNSSFLPRLYSSPMTVGDYVLGYVIPMIPVGLLQSVCCVATAFCLGLKPTGNVFLSLFTMLPVTLMFASLGLLLGVIFSTPAINAVSSIIVNGSALLSGTWFSLDMVGGKFKDFCMCLPFAHAVNAAAGVIRADYAGVFTDLVWVAGYAVLFFVLATIIFKKKMKA